MNPCNHDLLKFFGHVERVSEDQMTGGVNKSDIEDSRDRGGAHVHGFDDVKKACITRSLELRDTKVENMDSE